MAKLNTPLLSLGASGTIGKSITFGNWKGIHTARQRVIPTNPQSVLQTAQRDIMTIVVAFWRGFMTGNQAKESWNREANASGKAQSGFNSFTSVAAKVSALVPAASFATAVSTLVDTGGLMAVEMANLNTGATGTEAGSFTLNFGTSPSQMLSSVNAAIISGAIDFELGAQVEGAVIYAQVVKTAGTIIAAKRSGIFQVTIQPA